MSRNKQDASGQLSGYLYQVLMALYLLLDYKKNDVQLCIEKFDDVTFLNNDIPTVMVQTKHQLYKQGNLSDTSTDIWRTINSWCNYITQVSPAILNTRFLIVTTAISSENSAAAYLSSNSKRDTNLALKILREVASSSEVVSNLKFYKTFNALDADIQEQMIKQIYIQDASSNISDLKDEIMHYIRFVTIPPYEENVYDKLTGWWIRMMIQGLSSKDPVFINRRQLQQQLYDIGSEYKADSLPIDIDMTYQPSKEELDALQPENRIFIEQLNLISLSHSRLKRCIRDYYNAFCQRSKWVRESLLYVDDLTKYENILIDEWERLFLIMKEDIEDYGESITEEQKIKAGKKLLTSIEELDKPIRKQILEPFVMRGTYHSLANQLKVGWSVDFYERLCHLLKEN